MKKNAYEKYYKLGFDHLMFKEVMGLKKPKKKIKRFYLSLIVLIIATALLINNL